MARKDDQTVGGVLLIYFRGLQLHKSAPYSKERGVTWNELFAFSAVIIGVVTLVVTIMKKK